VHTFSNKIEFYITNVCNLTCKNCNRFNNHDFKGWQRWSDYEAIYEQWAELVDIPAIVLLGGEPLLNPTVVEWIHGLRRIFKCDVQVLTNGTRLIKTPGLYEAMQLRSPRNRAQNHIGISLHSLDDWPEIKQNIREFLKGPIKECGTFIGEPPNKCGSDYSATDANNVLINVWINDHFETSTLVTTSNSFTLHNNTPDEAHSNCGFAQWKCYHMIHGKLYKCGPVALLPEFDQQHPLDIPDSDRVLINSYKPLTIDNFAKFNQEFFENLNKPIDQCKFCPVSGDMKIEKLYPVRKGVVI
jgi:hypothetical protein